MLSRRCGCTAVIRPLARDPSLMAIPRCTATLQHASRDFVYFAISYLQLLSLQLRGPRTPAPVGLGPESVFRVSDASVVSRHGAKQKKTALRVASRVLSIARAELALGVHVPCTAPQQGQRRTYMPCARPHAALN